MYNHIVNKLETKRTALSHCPGNLGPVVQNFVSLTLSLIPQFVIYISTSKAKYTVNFILFFFFFDKILYCIAKDSHIFSTKHNSVFVILSFEILTNLTTSLILKKLTPDQHLY